MEVNQRRMATNGDWIPIVEFLQEQVVKEYRDFFSSIEEGLSFLQSAASRLPHHDAHWIKYNRARSSSLRQNFLVPLVHLFDLEGKSRPLTDEKQIQVWIASSYT